MSASLFHFRCRDGENIPIDPLPLELCVLTRAEHGKERPSKKKLHVAWRLGHDAHDVWQFFPVNGGHWLDARRCKNLAHALDWIVWNEACANGQIENLARAHQDPLEGGPLAGSLDRHDGVNDERRCDLIELTTANFAHDVLLNALLFVSIADDSAALEVLPQPEGVIQDVAALRRESSRLSASSSFLPCSFKGHFRPSSQCDVGDLAGFRQTEDPTFHSGRHDSQCQAVTVRNRKSFFARFEPRNFFGS